MSGNADNIFFDIAALKRCGRNVIIGKTVRIRYPELVEIGDNVIIDDFTYISTALILASYVHISAGCKLIGGRSARVEMGSFSTLAPNVVLAAGSDDYSGGVATPLVSAKFKGRVDIGYITLGEHCIVGANSTVLPNVRFGDGACLGTLSLAKQDLDAWHLFAGVPARKLKRRDEDGIKDLEAQFRRTLDDV
jgi:acetyltransferase-like isoleucine patch superfamily enzyme